MSRFEYRIGKAATLSSQYRANEIGMGKVQRRDIACNNVLNKIFNGKQWRIYVSELPVRSSGCIGHQSSAQTGPPGLNIWALLSGEYLATMSEGMRIRQQSMNECTTNTSEMFQKSIPQLETVQLLDQRNRE